MSPTPTTSAILSRAVPDLTFPLIRNLTTCQSTRILWELPGGPTTAQASSLMDLSLSSSTPFPMEDGTVTTTKTLVTDMRASRLEFTWLSVNVPPGSYSLMAAVDPRTRAQQIFQSSVFDVVEGQDTSCVPAEPVQRGDGLGGGVIAAICIAVGIVVLSVPGLYFLLPMIRKRRREARRKTVYAQTYEKAATSMGFSGGEMPASRSVYSGGSSSSGPSPTRSRNTSHHFSIKGTPTNHWRESSTFAATPIEPPLRRTSLPRMLTPIRRAPGAKEDVLPPLPESPESGASSRTDTVPTPTKSDSSGSTQPSPLPPLPTPLQPVRRSKSAKRPVPLLTTKSGRTISESQSPSTSPNESGFTAQPGETSSSSPEDSASTHGIPLSRTATNTTVSSLLSRSIPSIFRKSINHPVVYSAAKPESVFGMYVGAAKEGFDGRSMKSRPNSYYPAQSAGTPVPGSPGASGSNWAPPSAWTSAAGSNSGISPTLPGQSPASRSARNGARHNSRSSSTTLTPASDDGAGAAQVNFRFPAVSVPRPPPLPPPPIPPLPRPLPQPGMYRAGLPPAKPEVPQPAQNTTAVRDSEENDDSS